MSSTPSDENTLFTFDSQLELKQHLLKLSAAARQAIVIFSHFLEPNLYSDDHFVDAISSLARSSSNAKIRIVIQDPKLLTEGHHQLLHLSQRLVSKIDIQILTIEPQEPYEFLIADNNKLWLKHDKEGFSGFVNYDARPEVKRFSTLFEHYWKHSETDNRLRRLSL